MKGFLIFLIIIILLSIYFVKYLGSNIVIDYKITKIDISKLLKYKLSATLNLILDNKTPIWFTVGKLYFEIYYNKRLIVKTPKIISDTYIQANSTTEINGFILEADIVKESAELLSNVMQKKPIVLEIKSKISIFGMPIPFKTNYTYSDY